jgi:hypothetical protein
VETDPIFKLGTPKNLFTGPYYRDWDIDPDGRRFLMVKETEATGNDSTQGNPAKSTSS